VGKELPEASQVCGAGGFRTFLKVQLPIMAPGLAAGWCLLFVHMAGDLTASALLGGTQNPVVGYKILEVINNGSYALLAALSLVMTLVSAIGVFAVLLLTKRGSRWERSASPAPVAT
jgi:iron(III) transport system permease protein